MTRRSATIAGRAIRLSRTDVERAMRGVLPEPVKEHFVVVGSSRYPPKQVIAELTGLERSAFTSHHALRLLRRLGFTVGRHRPLHRTPVAEPALRRRNLAQTPLASHPPLVDRLREVRGQWVATRGDDLLVVAATPQEVVRWLAEHDQKAQSMFRVPEDPIASSGLAPL